MKTDVERPETMAFINEAFRNVDVTLSADDIIDIADALANHTRKVIAAIPSADGLREAAQKALNYIENTEGELGITLDCGDTLRAALAGEGK